MDGKTTGPCESFWRFLMVISALGALYNLSEIQGDIAGIRKALEVK